MRAPRRTVRLKLTLLYGAPAWSQVRVEPERMRAALLV